MLLSTFGCLYPNVDAGISVEFKLGAETPSDRKISMSQQDLHTKQSAYERLVSKRKECAKCLPFTRPRKRETIHLVNPARVKDGLYDSDEIGPWSVWQGSLNAKVMVIGKDFGPVSYFEDNKGGDSENNTTNRTIMTDICCSLGIPIQHPAKKVQSDLLFFTNSVLCLPRKEAPQKEAAITIEKPKMSCPICDKWIETCSQEFLQHLIGIVEPRIIIALGTEALKAVAYVYDRCESWGIKPSSKFKLTNIVDRRTPFREGNVSIFTVVHPSHINANRGEPMNSDDWAVIRKYLDTFLKAESA